MTFQTATTVMHTTAVRRVCGEPGCDWRGPTQWDDVDRLRAQGAHQEHDRSAHGIPPTPHQGSAYVQYERVPA